MDKLSYWSVFLLVFLCLCIREGARVRPDAEAPVSRVLRALFLSARSLWQKVRRNHD